MGVHEHYAYYQYPEHFTNTPKFLEEFFGSGKIADKVKIRDIYSNPMPILEFMDIWLKMSYPDTLSKEANLQEYLENNRNYKAGDYKRFEERDFSINELIDLSLNFLKDKRKDTSRTVTIKNKDIFESFLEIRVKDESQLLVLKSEYIRQMYIFSGGLREEILSRISTAALKKIDNKYFSDLRQEIKAKKRNNYYMNITVPVKFCSGEKEKEPTAPQLLGTQEAASNHDINVKFFLSFARPALARKSKIKEIEKIFTSCPVGLIEGIDISGGIFSDGVKIAPASLRIILSNIIQYAADKKIELRIHVFEKTRAFVSGKDKPNNSFLRVLLLVLSDPENFKNLSKLKHLHIGHFRRINEKIDERIINDIKKEKAYKTHIKGVSQAGIYNFIKNKEDNYTKYVIKKYPLNLLRI